MVSQEIQRIGGESSGGIFTVRIDDGVGSGRTGALQEIIWALLMRDLKGDLRGNRYYLEEEAQIKSVMPWLEKLS
jgi:hypothetical protein